MSAITPRSRNTTASPNLFSSTTTSPKPTRKESTKLVSRMANMMQ